MATVACFLVIPFEPAYAIVGLALGTAQTPLAQAMKSTEAQGGEAGGIELSEKLRAAMGFAEKRLTTEERRTETELMGQLNKTTRITERSTGRFYQVTEGANGTTRCP